MAITYQEKLEAAAEIIQLVKKYEGKLDNFTMAIGNPPYTENINATNIKNSSIGTAVYPDFFGVAFTMSDLVSIISPARWFNSPDAATRAARNTIKENDLAKHFALMFTESETSDVFPNVNFSGGVSWWLFDREYDGKTTFIRDGVIQGTQDLFNINGLININAEHNELLNKIWGTLNPGKETLHFQSLNQRRQLLDFLHGVPNAFKQFGDNSTKTILDNTTVERINETDDRVRIPQHGWRYASSGILEDYSSKVPAGKFAICFTHASHWKRARHLNDRTFFLSENESAKATIALIVDSPHHAANFYKYANTNFFRILVEARLNSHSTMLNAYQDVPAFKWDETDPIDWTKSVSEIDAQLEEYFDLDDLHDYLQSPDAPFAAPFEDEYIQKFASYGIDINSI